MITVDSAVASNLVRVANELRDLVTSPPYLADRAPYAAGRLLAAADRLDRLAERVLNPSAPPGRVG
jgi:hypothetical protein